MNKQNYIPVIGLEIHIELKTKSKMFCQCNADYFGAEPNTHVCPVCLGLPGALPVPNKKAILWMQKIGSALGCELPKHSKFDRKHYSYPDLPKGYQISQYKEPFAINGEVLLVNPYLKGVEKKFHITQVHMEEDTAKLIHEGNSSLIDFNRSSVPLVEVVTEPDFTDATDVKAFLEELQVIVRYLGVSDADMEKGSMRLEPNISVRKPGKTELPNYKVEVKNINSFKFVKAAIDFEVKRQIEILEKGETPKQETRGYDDVHGGTYSQRSKEEAQDYRYFPEPDIPPFNFSNEYIDEVKKSLPELPSTRLNHFVKEYRLKPIDAFILTRDKKTADYFESIATNEHITNAGQTVANVIINKKISTSLSVEAFITEFLKLTKPIETNRALLDTTVSSILTANKKAVTEYKNGKVTVIMFLVGQVMREMKGRADASIVRKALEEKLQV
ncbi:Asp-tRNA(Asn)/Glu-tRNA(Gln) amidotransferase GatCAB subunit B [Candidatus Roizmanbacteria bacterium CG_4_10_14_3_um_filter_39_13]|uniref:Aspartyl/glutamyl-tRNA(Asn/Gln) amidotransferase subunit B n=1 Tax=Candidatus Roizmanbacteria bacterium CG_4_10_14_3_um_filter_39_13 TaxID=1974831 RepID=A0A2M7LKU4_9BACT|nr:MAG: Asp-tRNA(Asn)/Glu-tRNA(Gln) amidotransferase GatCAB subunit B [Candidatus Roizmanbacteria bacterium CG_4_10_14_3_um_filter_39_13]